MFVVFLLWLLAPLSIYLGLIIFNSVHLTFILFFGGICLAIPLFDLLVIQKKRLRDFFILLGFQNFKKASLPAVCLGILFCASIYSFFVLLQNYVLDLNHIQFIFDEWRIEKKHIIQLMVIMIIANSVLEEIYWRGYIYNKLESKVKPMNVLLLTSLFYASYHLITTITLFSFLYGLLFSIVIFGIGFFWAFMREKYDSLYFPVISHLLADLGIMLIYFKYFSK